MWDVTKEPTPKGDVVLGHWTGLCWYVWLSVSTSPWYGASFLLYLLTATLLHRGVFVLSGKRKRAGHVASSSTSARFLFFDHCVFYYYFIFYWNIQWEPSLQRREELHYKSGLSTLTRQCSPAKLLNCVTPSTLSAL